MVQRNLWSENLGHMKVTRGKFHDYLVMTMDFNIEGAFNIDIKNYIKGMLEEFP